ncbi:MAG: DUF4118 domain-containing protein [Eubacteriales bacterium]|nr:DUF4118 domain-containing protein [Eubacteriales bacterium]
MDTGRPARAKNAAAGKRKLREFAADGGLTAGILAVTTALCRGLQEFSGADNHAPLLFMLAVLLIARHTKGYGYGIFSSMLAVVLVNYVFTPPYYELNFTITGYPLTFAVMLAASVSVSALTTQIKRQEQVRLEVEKEKQRANLLRAMSHDIRTPLTAIQASASGILDNYDALGRQEKLDLIRDIREESQWLVRMVENLLSITRINGEHARIQTAWEAVEEVVGGAVAKFRKQFSQIEVETRLPQELVLVQMDGILIEQVLVNLLVNAAIHGKTTSRILIGVTVLEDRVVFSVEDNGQGIDKALLPVIFEGAAPAEREQSDGRRNMGIGLSVCMSIVRAHRGGMRADNREGEQGARVQFWLPQQGEEKAWM